MIFNTILSVIKNGDSGEGETNLFNLDLETISGRIKFKSLLGSGTTAPENLAIIDNSDSFEIFNIDIETDYDNIKYNQDYIASGFTDDLVFYDYIKQYPTSLSVCYPLQITFPAGSIYSYVYNKQINYKSKSVYFYDYTDEFDYPIIDYVDDGSEVTMKMYAVYSETKCEMVLLNRTMTSSDIPSGFTDFIYIKDVVIPEHHPCYGYISTTSWTRPNLTSNGTMGGTSYACNADSYYSSSYYQYYAFDSSTSTYWRNNHNSTPTWITFYSPNPIYVTSVVFSFASIASAGRIEGSNDNSSWTTLGSFSGNSSNPLTVNCTSSIGYKYIRFYRTGTYSGSYGGIYNMAITGYRKTVKWYCKDLLTYIKNNGASEPETFYNRRYYSPNGKFVEYNYQKLITTNEDETGCLYKFTDSGYGSLTTKSYVIEKNNSGIYNIAITDKTISEIQTDASITYVEEIDNYVLPSHYNFEYNGGSGSLTPNFAVVGTLTENNRAFSGFSINDYIKIPNVIQTTPTSFECVLCLKTPSSWNSSINSETLGLNGSDYDFFMLIFETGYSRTAGTMSFYTKSGSSSWTQSSSSTALSSNTKYYIKIYWNGSTWTISYSTNGSTYTSLMTQSSSWPSNMNNFYCIGESINSWSGNCPFRGTIYMDECYINVNGTRWWEGYTESDYTLKNQLQTSSNFISYNEPTKFTILRNDSMGLYPKNIIKEQNFSIVGSLTNNDGIFSGFSASNYLKHSGFSLSSPDCEIVVKFKNNSTASSTWNPIFDSVGYNSGNGFLIWTSASPAQLHCEMQYNGTKLTVGFDDSTNPFNVQPNTWYYVKVKLTSSELQLIVSENEDFSNSKMTSKPTNGNYCSTMSEMWFGKEQLWNGSYYFSGYLDMNKCYVKNNGTKWWEGYTLYGSDTYDETHLASYLIENDNLLGCLVNYTDDGSANTIKAYKVDFSSGDNRVILTNDVSFILDDMTSKTFLADIVIPEHKLFTYGQKTTEVSWTRPNLTSNGTMGGSSNACAASSYYSSSYYPYYAFYSSTSNTWQSNSGNYPHWITYYTPTAVYIDRVRILLTSYNPMFYEIQGSNNNSSWTTLVDDLNKVNSSGSTIEIPVNSENAYKYIRLYGKKGYNASYMSVNKFYIYGHTFKTENGWISVSE